MFNEVCRTVVVYPLFPVAILLFFKSSKLTLLLFKLGLDICSYVLKLL